MSRDLRRISLSAVILIVLLRIAIGWHLMYEGLWKIKTLRTANPWSSMNYLRNATGPFRPLFRRMSGDPDDLKWLDQKHVTDRWNAWRGRFLTHYSSATNDNDSLKTKLSRLMEGADLYSVPLATLPPGIELGNIDGVHKKVLKFDVEKQRLIIDGKLHLLPTERDRLLETAERLKQASAGDPQVYDSFIKAINDAYKVSSKLSIFERLAALLKGDPERVGLSLQNRATTNSSAEGAAKEGESAAGDAAAVPVLVQLGEVDLYLKLIDRYEADYAKAHTNFEWDHVEKQSRELREIRWKLVNPVQSLERELIANAEELLSPEQFTKGPIPLIYDRDSLTHWVQEHGIDYCTMWGLAIFGLFLMLGLLTRSSAIAAAALLSMFYLAMPPWPGAQEIPGIEHNLIVNKVLVEALALVALACLHSGQWFGLDSAVSAVFRKRMKTG